MLLSARPDGDADVGADRDAVPGAVAVADADPVPGADADPDNGRTYGPAFSCAHGVAGAGSDELALLPELWEFKRLG